MEKYNDLKQECERLKKRIDEESDECAKMGLSFDEMIEKTKDLRTKLHSISQEMRLIQEPSMTFGKKWKGELMTLDKFKELSLNQSLIDNDGTGYYATETGKSDIIIYPSDILENKYRSDFSHVLWLNK